MLITGKKIIEDFNHAETVQLGAVGTFFRVVCCTKDAVGVIVSGTREGHIESLFYVQWVGGSRSVYYSDWRELIKKMSSDRISFYLI